MASNKELVEYLNGQGVITSKEVRGAFERVDRAKFVPEEKKTEAYDDYPIELFGAQTISQPSTVSFMLELLGTKKGDRVLEIGGGSGWVTALLGHLVGDEGYVYSYEINDQVGGFGQSNLRDFGLSNYEYKITDAKTVWKNNAPYDRIISGAAFPNGIAEIVSLLKKDGVAVIPTTKNDVRRIIKDENNNIIEEVYRGFVFVPLIWFT